MQSLLKNLFIVFALVLFVAVNPPKAHAISFDELVSLFPSFSASTTPALEFSPTYSVNSLVGGWINHININPTITVGVNPSIINDIHVGGTIHQTVEPGSLYFVSSLKSDKVFYSDTNGVSPSLPDTIFDNYTVEYRATNGTANTPYVPISFLGAGNLGAINGANLTTGPVVTLYSRPTLYATGNGSLYSTPFRAGLYAIDFIKNETGGGSVNVGINAGVYLDPLVNGADNRSLYSKGISAALVNVGPARFGSDGRPRGGSTLDVDGGLTVKRTMVSDTNYTAKLSDYIIGYTSMTAPRTVTLPNPATVGSGKVYIVKDECACASPNEIIVVASGSTINGVANKKILQDYGSLNLYSSGTEWFTW